MKRGGPMKRYARLVARKHWERKAGKPMRQHKPKPPEERTFEKHGRATVRARSGGICEIQWIGCTGIATDFHHRVRESQGGTHAPSNGLDACRMCHMLVTREPAWAREYGWCLWSFEDPAAEPVWHGAGFHLHTDDGQRVPVEQEENAA